MDNDEIELELRRLKSNNHLKLTSRMDYTIVGKVLTLTLNYPYSNMQSNEAAFEAWAIVLKSAFGDDINKVSLDFGHFASDPKKIGHFHRLLWRIYNFDQMFDWFEMGNVEQAVTDFVNHDFQQVRINKPSVNRGVVTGSNGERKVESLFVDKTKPYFAQLCKLINADFLVNQIPVGLFKGEVITDNHIFTHGASAIDIVGFEDKSTLHLIELKKGDNDDLGIISEFLLYAFIMRGVFMHNTITYPDLDFPTDFRDYAEIIRNRSVKLIKGHLLYEKIHPLIDHDAIDLLNKGLEPTMSVDRIAYDYDEINETISNLRKE